MDERNETRIKWPAMLFVALMLAAAFAVSILGPLRESGARIILAIAMLIVAAGLVLLIEATGR